jgi:hypothetical protein
VSRERLDLDPDVLLRACRLETFRASGPGGQKRNKTSSAVRLTHEPTGISSIANESRSQARNRQVALERLRHRLALEQREPIDVDDAFAPPDWFTQNLARGGRLSLSPRSPDYLRVMRFVLDVLEAVGWSVSDAGRLLRVTTANLVDFLQADDKLWAHVNRRRADAGLRGLN